MGTDDGEPSSQAKQRLEQVSSHLNNDSNTSSSKTKGGTKQRRKQEQNALPADYSDVLSQIRTLKEMAATPDLSRRGYVRQKEAGKLWVRERVTMLLDEGSLREVGSVSGTVDWRVVDEQAGTEEPVAFTPSNNVQGFGLLGGRKVCISADDYSLRAGHADGALWSKTAYMEKMALALKIPVIKLVDGSSGGGSVTTIRTQGYSYVPPLNAFDAVVAQLNEGIPNLGAVLGPAIGLGAARAVACHFSVMAADIGSLFNAGPKVVAGATFEEDLSLTDLGGPDVHCRNGTIDNLAANETDAFDQLRRMLAYLPNSGASLPPVVVSDDPASRTETSLRTLVPRRKERMFNPRRLLEAVVDRGSFFEIGALWGTTVIVGLARFAGQPAGIVMNNCESNAGALDAGGAMKLTKHLKLCDVMNLPVVQFVDVPGYAVGTAAERAATMRHGVALVTAYYSTTMPVFSVLVRRAYGVAGGAMLDCRDPRMRVAWPSGDWGSLPLAGGIEVGHSAELKQAARDGGQEAADALYRNLERDYRRLMNPVRTANAFSIEEIIDPADTRPVVCQWLTHVYAEILPIRLTERASGKIKPFFA